MNKNISVYIFFLVLAVFLLISNGRFSGDGLENYFTAESIVLDKDLSIHDRPFEVKEMRARDRGVVGADGKLYSPYGIGMPLLLIPFYFAGHILAGVFKAVPHDYITNFITGGMNSICSAFSVIVLFKILVNLGYKDRTTIWAVFIYAFSTMAFVYVRSGFSDPMLTLMYLCAMLYLFKFKNSKKTTDLLISGIFLAYSILIKKNAGIMMPVYFGYVVSLSYENRDYREMAKNVIIYLTPFILAGVVMAYMNYEIFGSILKTEHGDIIETFKKTLPGKHFIKGIYYYLFSSGKGYFFYNIPLILSLFGISSALKKYKKEGIFILFLVLAHLVFYAHVFKRGSLFSWGPRYLLPTVPLMIIFLAEYIDTAPARRLFWTMRAFVLAGFLVQLPALFINFSNFIYFVKEKLGLNEYLINFIPDLSLIKGSWALFRSLLSQILHNQGIVFVFNPDYMLVEPRDGILSGYDSLDIWWGNIVAVHPDLLPCVIFTGIVLFSICFVNIFALVRLRKKD